MYRLGVPPGLRVRRVVYLPHVVHVLVAAPAFGFYVSAALRTPSPLLPVCCLLPPAPSRLLLPGVIKLGDQQLESKVTLVYGQMNEPPGARARVALTGLTVAEYFRDEEGQDVLLFVDNIFRFTQVGGVVGAWGLICGWLGLLAGRLAVRLCQLPEPAHCLLICKTPATDLTSCPLPAHPPHVQANSEVSALLGRIPSAVGYQPTLATDLGQLQERITTTKKGSITSVQVGGWVGGWGAPCCACCG